MAEKKHPLCWRLLVAMQWPHGETPFGRLHRFYFPHTPHPVTPHPVYFLALLSPLKQKKAT
ncbi:MAG: hypothetical protein F6K56_05810 [Moorea sp. SIO3G5]|nr:hypothetical protein [Moorena sp. SIO3G5]